jgi:hypothetical protein
LRARLEFVAKGRVRARGLAQAEVRADQHKKDNLFFFLLLYDLLVLPIYDLN